MNGTTQISDCRRDEILDKTIKQRARATVTHRTRLGWRSHKSTITGRDAATGGIVVQTTITDDQDLEFLPQPPDLLGVSFRLGHKKCMLSSALKDVVVEGSTVTLHLAEPDTLRQLKRRLYERAEPPAGQTIAVRFWRAGKGNTSGRCVRHGQLEDLSAGGMRIRTADLTDVEMNQDYECIFTARQGTAPIVVEATLCHREATTQGRAALGFRFVGLETTVEGQNTLDRLARIVSRFQRARNKKRVQKTASP